VPLTYLGAGFQPAAHLLPVAQAAQAAGFDGLAVPDHVAYPATIDTAYPGTDDGQVPWKLDETPWIDPLVAVSVIAAVTDLRLMTHILVLPLRSPVLMAKTAGSIAALFPGRFDLGVGVGWLPDEFALTQTEFRTRGRRTDEAIEVLRALWGAQPASHDGPHYGFAGIGMFPVPETPPPLLVGGSSETALDRAARLGDGYVAMPATVEEYGATIVPAMHHALQRHGRSPEGFHVNVVPSDVTCPEDLVRLHQMGVTSVQLHPFDRDTAVHGSLERKLDAIGTYAEKVLA
jgi:probable F420-dependent oxidoreductase